MERTDSDQADTPATPPKPVTWHSGWRLLVTLAVAVVAAKLLGLLGAFIAFLIFFWLQPKRGTGLAIAVSVVAGVAVAVIYSAVVLPTIYGQQQKTPTTSSTSSPGYVPFNGKLDGEKKPFTYEEAVGGDAAKPTGISPGNPFSDPDYGKELLQKSQ